MPRQTEARAARATIAASTGITKTTRPGPWKQMDSSRISRARYDSGLRQIQVNFRDGTPWIYDDVPPNVWKNLRRSASPGRFVNRVLNAFPYYRAPIDWDEYDETLAAGPEAEPSEPAPYAGINLYDDELR